MKIAALPHKSRRRSAAAAAATVIAVIVTPTATAKAETVGDNVNLNVEQPCSGNGRVECHFPRPISCTASAACNYTVRVEGRAPGDLSVQACASGSCSGTQSGTGTVSAELANGMFPRFQSALDFYGVGTADHIDLVVRIQAWGIACGSAGGGCL
jgi:hypothetical protein